MEVSVSCDAARKEGRARLTAAPLANAVSAARTTAVTLISKYHIEPQTGVGFRLAQNQLLKIIDPRGEQVSDLTAFASADKSEWLSSGRSIDYANTIYLTTNHTLYSNRSRPMFTIVEDTVGRHDFLLTPCSPETFEILYPEHQGYHPSCFENLHSTLR